MHNLCSYGNIKIMVDENAEHPIKQMPAAEWLKITEPHSTTSQIDIALAQDAFNGKVSLSLVSDLLQSRKHDRSLRGNSLSTWLYRVGGSEAVLNAMNHMPRIDDNRKVHLAIIARNMIKDDSWTKNPTDGSLDFIRVALQTAIDRGRTDVISVIGKYLEGSSRISHLMFKEADVSDLQKRISEYTPGKAPDKKPVYDITDATEAESEFLKESAKYVDPSLALEHDYTISMMRPPAMYDRAFWLTMRLGELGDIDFLKKQIGNDDVGLDVKKEIVRQFGLKQQHKFLGGYVLATSTGPRSQDRSATRGLESPEDSFLPAYTAAIVDLEKQI